LFRVSPDSYPNRPAATDYSSLHRIDQQRGKFYYLNLASARSAWQDSWKHKQNIGIFLADYKQLPRSTRGRACANVT